MTLRVSFFIDGFNVYHSLRDNPNFAHLRKYRWLNYRRLCEFFLNGGKIKDLFYFTAYATWKPQGLIRHQAFVRALELHNVTPVFGKFKEKNRFCNNCRRKFNSHEEKQTDVNIAIRLFEEALKDSYDVAVVASGDSDLVPAIRAIKRSFPHKIIKVLIPIGRRAEELKEACSQENVMKIRETHLKQSQFPDVVEVDGFRIEKPVEWQ